ncbi:MscS Mechanosensitive ion channel [Desulfurispirillum indicum S5]|uniref:MscS Mechanosensitive ion channel n=1 Tax=Desulfurispirillum indicum (strain ATCC BAA-1389 / DSM 22839 / S5) TaxID=653733 RepID=E6W191_DESIS|nr:mechanosensitive ion channel domain-containing protein [Desulfurispirillum indicum]ADU66511.1 MscS Mechanosensitive ion channel [Desulfurispirillum indicum S5]
MSYYFLTYLGVVGLSGAIILWWVRSRVRAIEDQRATRVEDFHRFDAVRTTSPHKNPVQKARSRALESIANRFTIIRRVLVVGIFLVWILALILPFLGLVPAAVVSTFAAAFAVILGIAAKTFVQNFIAGVVISFSNQLRIGDTVIMDGNYGTVEDISITHTVVKIWDWRRYIIPNSRMLEKEFINYTITDSYIWAHIEFWVSYEADLEVVEKVALEIAEHNPYSCKVEPPSFWYMGLDKEGVKCWLAAWASHPSDAWNLRSNMRSQLKKELEVLGIHTHFHRHMWVPDAGPQTDPAGQPHGSSASVEKPIIYTG